MSGIVSLIHFKLIHLMIFFFFFLENLSVQQNRIGSFTQITLILQTLILHSAAKKYFFEVDVK